MTEIIISTAPGPDAISLGIRWRKCDGLLNYSAVRVKTDGTPEELAIAIRELADKIERQAKN